MEIYQHNPSHAGTFPGAMLKSRVELSLIDWEKMKMWLYVLKQTRMPYAFNSIQYLT